MSGKADERSAPRSWERVTPCQLEMLEACAKDEYGQLHAGFRWMRSIWSLTAKGYVKNLGQGWYEITQRGRDYLRFGKRRKRGTR